VASQKKTHLSRSSGAKTAELKGVSEDQIRRAGRWNQEQMVGCYLNSLPRKFMRTMAGHPAQTGCFEVPRAGVAPPSVLLSMIWPQLDDWKGRFGLQPGQVNDLAAMGVTNLLFYLREVVLQDSVAMRARFPDSPVWNHAVFQHEAYEVFAQRMRAAVGDDEGQRPSRLGLLAQAVPALADYLHCMDARIEAGNDKVQEALSGIEEQVRAQGAYGARLHRQLTSGSLTLQVKLADLVDDAPPSRPPPSMLGLLGGSDSSRYASARASLAPEEPPSLLSSLEALEPPCHSMCRTVRTVEALWREWTVGLRGQPSVGALDSRWGSRWRSGRPKEQQWYSLRLEVVREIRRLAKAQRGGGEERAMWALHQQQERVGYSLDRFCKQLREARKARGGAGESTGTGNGRGKARGIDRGTDKDKDTDRGTDKDTDRGIDKDIDRGTDKDIDTGP